MGDVKLRLIAGTINRYVPEDGWRNLHLDKSIRGIYDAEADIMVLPEFCADIQELAPFRDGMFDEVRCWHTLEHLTYNEARLAAKAVYRVLKPGGVFDVEVPDLDALCVAWIERSDPPELLLQHFYSEDVDMIDSQYNAHRYGYNQETLTELLCEAGFEVPEEREDAARAVRLRAWRP